MSAAKPQVGDMRVWWIPQVPGQRFYVKVESPSQARFVLETLAEYDLFQYRNKIKPDYSNAGGLEIFEADAGHANAEWCEWNDESGDDIHSAELAGPDKSYESSGGQHEHHR